MNEELEDLLWRIRLDGEEIAERRRFLDWDEADARRLNGAAARLASSQQAFVERLYAHLASSPYPPRC